MRSGRPIVTMAAGLGWLTILHAPGWAAEGARTRPARQPRLEQTRLERKAARTMPGGFGPLARMDWEAVAQRIGLQGQNRDEFVKIAKEFEEERIKFEMKRQEVQQKLQDLLTPTQLQQYQEEFKKEQQRVADHTRPFRPEILKEALDGMSGLTQEQRATIDALIKRFREEGGAMRGQANRMQRIEKVQKLVADIMGVLNEEQKGELLEKASTATGKAKPERPQRPERGERPERGPRAKARKQAADQPKAGESKEAPAGNP